MNKTRNEIFRVLKKIRKSTFWGKEIDDCVFNMFERRASRIGVRGYFIRKIYEYVVFLASKENISLQTHIPEYIFKVKLPFLVEGVIALQYLDNQILDRKGGVSSPEKINRNLLASKLFGLFLRRNYVSGTFLLPADEKQKIDLYLEKMFENVDVGQCMEKRYGSYLNFINGLPKDEAIQIGLIEKRIPYAILNKIWLEINQDKIPIKHEQFVRQYLKRVYLCNASLFVQAAELIMDLLSYEGHEKENILHFAAYYGMVIQFVNDNNDYLHIETVGKKPEDAFSDLMNGTMALPLIYYFKDKNGKNGLRRLQKMVAKSEKQTLREMLPTLENHAIPFTKRIALMAVKFLNKEYEDYELLADMANIAHDNKYYRIYKFENTNLNI